MYFQLISMVGLGYVIFGDVPDVWSLVGSLVVVGSGIYLVHREHALHKEAVAATARAC